MALLVASYNVGYASSQATHTYGYAWMAVEGKQKRELAVAQLEKLKAEFFQKYGVAATV